MSKNIYGQNPAYMLFLYLRSTGFEPATNNLEGCCSIQFELRTSIIFSEWHDLNMRLPAPKAGTLTGLRYTPYNKKYS